MSEPHYCCDVDILDVNYQKSKKILDISEIDARGRKGVKTVPDALCR